MRAAMDTLFVRLTALEAMVMQKPIITGRYSESPYINFMKPIEARLHGSAREFYAVAAQLRNYGAWGHVTDQVHGAYSVYISIARHQLLRTSSSAARDRSSSSGVRSQCWRRC